MFYDILKKVLNVYLVRNRSGYISSGLQQRQHKKRGYRRENVHCAAFQRGLHKFQTERESAQINVVHHGVGVADNEDLGIEKP